MNQSEAVARGSNDDDVKIFPQQMKAALTPKRLSSSGTQIDSTKPQFKATIQVDARAIGSLLGWLLAYLQWRILSIQMDTTQLRCINVVAGKQQNGGASLACVRG